MAQRVAHILHHLLKFEYVINFVLENLLGLIVHGEIRVYGMGRIQDSN